MYRRSGIVTLAALLVALIALAAPAAGEEKASKIEIRNAKTPLPGVLTGGQPTEEQIEEAAAAGYRTVLNLRPPGEEGAWDVESKATELGLRYVAIPVQGAEGLTEDNVRRFAEVLAEEELRPMMIHCASGNRVGALFALKAFHLDGKSAEAALEIGRQAGLTRLEAAVRERLEKSQESP